MIATLISVVVVLLLVGLVVYLVDQKIPIPVPFKTAIYVVIVIGLLLWIGQLAGLWRIG